MFQSAPSAQAGRNLSWRCTDSRCTSCFNPLPALRPGGTALPQLYCGRSIASRSPRIGDLEPLDSLYHDSAFGSNMMCDNPLRRSRNPQDLSDSVGFANRCAHHCFAQTNVTFCVRIAKEGFAPTRDIHRRARLPQPGCSSSQRVCRCRRSSARRDTATRSAGPQNRSARSCRCARCVGVHSHPVDKCGGCLRQAR